MRAILSLFVVSLGLSAPVLATDVVPVAGFKNVELRGGGEIVIVPGQAQRVTLVEGSTAFTAMRVDRAGRLTIDACNRNCPQHYRLRIEIQSPRLPGVGVTGGGSIRASDGFAPQDQVAAGVNGGGKIDLRAVEGSNVAAGVSGGGEILVRARNTLSAGVSGGGTVRFLGNPRVTSAVDGGGSVKPIG